MSSLLLKVAYDDTTKTMKFNASDTVAAAIEKIRETFKKTGGQSQPSPQAAHTIFYMSSSVLCSPGSDDAPLSSLPLKNMVWVTLSSHRLGVRKRGRQRK